MTITIDRTKLEALTAEYDRRRKAEAVEPFKVNHDMSSFDQSSMFTANEIQEELARLTKQVIAAGDLNKHELFEVAQYASENYGDIEAYLADFAVAQKGHESQIRLYWEFASQLDDSDRYDVGH